MKYLLAFTWVIVLFSCKEEFDTKMHEENKIDLAQSENEHPEKFLKVSSDDKKNLFGITVIKGKIVNTASVTVYKNTRIKMLCFKNGIRLEEHEEVVPDIIKPGTVKNYKTKYHLPKSTDSVALYVISADALNGSIAVSKK
jgi:hypothetical protein